MIIHKSTKSVETSSISTNENFGNYENVFVVDDSSELGQKILINQPYFDFVLDSNNNLIDVVPIEKPPEPIKPLSEIETLRLEQVQTKSELITIKQTFNLIPPIENTITLEDYQQNKIYELNVACEQEILAGFYSSCRGTQEFFTNSRDDQNRVISQATLATLNPSYAPEWKSASETICTPFTMEQIVQLATEGATFMTERIKMFETLRNQVVACETIECVGEIVWENYVW